ncbi:MAG: HAD-IA family hydrolase [Clostridia bacterium]|nr:HAD-IA family hydrolase [Clostridia bacterium]
MSINCIVFDLDGTLLNTLDDLANGVNYTLEKFGYPTHEIEKYKIFVGNGMKNLINRAVPEEIKNTEIEKDILAAFMEYYSAHSTDLTCPYDGVEDMIDALKDRGIKIGMVTNKAHNAAIDIMEKYFSGKFDYVLGQSEKFPLKPNPASAIFVCETLGCTPENSIFVGDSGVDMKTGADGGFLPVGVLWGFRDKDELISNGAKAVISHPAELLKIVDE